MYFDLHSHTFPASDDAFVGVDDLIEGAKQTGLDGLCLTEHDHFWDPETLLDLSKRHRFPVLGGAEINTDEGHVLVFGLHGYRFGMHKVDFLRQLVDQAGGFMVAAHPYRRRYPRGDSAASNEVTPYVEKASREQFFSLCHSIEVMNGRGTRKQNLFSSALGQVLATPGTGGSDSHRLEQLGTACTWFHQRVNSLDDLVRELRSGQFEAYSGVPGQAVVEKG